MKRFLSTILFLLVVSFASAQTPVVATGETQDINGKKYYVHVVQPGQTVYSISKAYGVKQYDAVTRKDIHLLGVGDTVWLPCRGQQIPTGTQDRNANAEPSYQYVKVEPGQTLYGISKLYNVTIEDLIQLNPDLSDGGLKAGQTLKIPANGLPVQSPAKDGGDDVNVENGKQFSDVEIRKRIDPNKVFVSVLMPLNLSLIDEISTTKFDIEQRGQKRYKSFEFIQFYEGLLMGLERLERSGCQVVLNVVDVPSGTDADVEQAFKSHDVANSDFIIALLTRQPFEKAAALAKQNKVFIINPLSTRYEIVLNNPYVVKCMPSRKGQVESLLRSVQRSKPNAHIYVVHSGSRAENAFRDELVRQLDASKQLKYTLFDWSASSRFSSTMKQTPNALVVSIYDQGRDKTRIYVNSLLNKMLAIKTNVPQLFSFVDFSKEYNDLDYGHLQHVNFATIYNDMDRSVDVQKRFAEDFENRFKVEPIGNYAVMANDIILYFVSGVHTKGADFWKDPNIKCPSGMISSFKFERSESGFGFENQRALVYKMNDYKFVPFVSGK